MKLAALHEGHWKLSPDDVPYLDPKNKAKDKAERHSPLKKPSDREKFLKWSSNAR
jgi:hypothetical protein